MSRGRGRDLPFGRDHSVAGGRWQPRVPSRRRSGDGAVTVVDPSRRLESRRVTTTVSAIVPTYNRREMLARALDSIAAQTRPVDEVLVVDDGSTDGSAEMLAARFPGARRLRCERLGVSAARNRGIAAASGEWVAFLDSDDEWRPAKIERQLAALAAAPEHDLCHTDEVWIRDGVRVNPRRRHAKAGGWIFERCLPLCAISPSSAMVRRAVFDRLGGFDEALPACEDYDFWLRFCSRQPVLYVDEPLVVKHGGHPDQLSRAVVGLDRYRIRALSKVLGDGVLASRDRRAAARTLCEKIDVYAAGARKRGRHAEVDELLALRERWAGVMSGGTSP